MSLHFFGLGRVEDLKAVVLSLHADEGLDVTVQEDGLVDGQGTDDHLGDGVEDAAFPVLVVREHLRKHLSARFESVFLNLSEESSTDLLVILLQLTEFVLSGGIEPVHQVLSLSDGVSLEINGADDLSLLDSDHILLNVSSLLEDSALHFSELVDLNAASGEVLSDREGEPVVVAGSLLHL